MELLLEGIQFYLRIFILYSFSKPFSKQFLIIKKKFKNYKNDNRRIRKG